ncbi:helix-turn-helix domain-containing protein [Sphingomonas asaccharolytica]|uniref:helix-turn-helix domain-containing protein n=1 Tax=Sphingomonas asaccharolytica TaxID=40681 RepID=UPI000832415A|nr:helix-turn-helix transcriptional regulator [Sphingomonas asaccharolytica]
MDDSRFSSLTPREIECLKGVAQHKRTKDIATDLQLSPKTVDAYIANAVRKLGFSDRDSAVRALMSSSAMIEGFSSSAISGVEKEISTASSSWLGRLPWPFPTRERPTNDLNYSGTIAAILVAASLMVTAVSLYMLAIRMLTERL